MARPIFKSSSTETLIAASESWLSNGAGIEENALIQPVAAISGTQEV